MNAGIVIIGRNEGERLARALQSVRGSGLPVVYVDSDSRDGSVELARSSGAEVVALDGSAPMSAARARNSGFSKLMSLYPQMTSVQFVDGDCEVCPGWLARGVQELRASATAAVVCGRVIERQPEASIYNRLCDLEWRREPGEIKACGGIFMVRAELFAKVGGFREDVIAAEEDELCLRIRRDGWKILSLDADMVRHDAAMTRFSQWWKRAKRCGHAYAQGAALHGHSPEQHFVHQYRGLWIWGLLVPLTALGLAWWTWGMSLFLLGLYPLLAFRVYRYGRRRGWSSRDACLYSFFTVLAKWPMLMGMVQYHSNQWRGRRPVLIEYKEVGKIV